MKQVIIEERDLKEGELPVNRIIHGNALTTLKKLPSESVDCVITSPPFWGLRDYGTDTKIIWNGDPNCNHEWQWKTGRKYAGGTNSIIGQFSDTHTHFTQKYATCRKCGAWYGELGQEPTLELYFKHLLEIMKELKRVLKKTGIIFWNHGSHYVRKCDSLQNYRFILKCIEKLDLILRNVIIWHKPNAIPESVKDRFSRTYDSIFMLVKNNDYFFDLDAVRVPAKTKPHAPGWRRETLESAKQSVGRRDRYNDPNKIWGNPLGRNPGDVWSIPTQPQSGQHFATFPITLIRPLISVGCPQKICKKCGRMYKLRENNKECGCNAGWRAGIVLDPFSGSGTTLLAALQEGRNFVGIELNKEYCDMSLKRIEPYLKQRRLSNY